MPQKKVNRLILIAYSVLLLSLIIAGGLFWYNQHQKEMFIKCFTDDLEAKADMLISNNGQLQLTHNLIKPTDTIQNSYDLYKGYSWLSNYALNNYIEMLIYKCSSDTGYSIKPIPPEYGGFKINIDIQPEVIENAS